MDSRYEQYTKFAKRVEEMSMRAEDEKKTQSIKDKLSGLAAANNNSVS